jgi:hypothetical protein
MELVGFAASRRWLEYVDALSKCKPRDDDPNVAGCKGCADFTNTGEKAFKQGPILSCADRAKFSLQEAVIVKQLAYLPRKSPGSWVIIPVGRACVRYAVSDLSDPMVEVIVLRTVGP